MFRMVTLGAMVGDAGFDLLLRRSRTDENGDGMDEEDDGP